MVAPLINAATIEQLLETTDAEFVAELINTYCEETPQLIGELQRALAEGNVESFRRAAHSIKSNSNSLGALEFASSARDLELMGKAGDLSAAGPNVQRLTDEYTLVEHALRELQHAT